VIIPAVPVPLRVFCDLLGRDQGRMLGSAVLFASVVGLDVVEQRKGDIAAISGVPETRVQEIVATGRQALSSSSPKRPEQHVVSQVILRRFLGPTPQGDRLLAHNLQYGKARLLSPREVGKLRDFVQIDSEGTEQLWGRTEQELPAAIDAARTRRVLQNTKHVAVIKDAIALHFARSLDTLQSVNQSWQQTLDAARAAYLADQPAMEELFYRKHGFAASGSAVAEEIADDLLRTAKDLYENGAYFRLRVVDVFEEAGRMAASARLEIIRPSRSNSRFLLGDVPAISYDARRGSLGIPGGVPFGDATTVFMPLTPTRLAALSRTDRYEAVPSWAVRQVNAFQVAKAHDYVYMHPDSGLQAFVLSERPPTGPRQLAGLADLSGAAVREVGLVGGHAVRLLQEAEAVSAEGRDQPGSRAHAGVRRPLGSQLEDDAGTVPEEDPGVSVRQTRAEDRRDSPLPENFLLPRLQPAASGHGALLRQNPV
jgi:hypothetical protein